MDDDNKPFIAWNFMAKEKNSNSEKSNVSLELSLSPPSTASTDKRIEENPYKKTEHCTMSWEYCMEKSSRAFQSEPNNADVSLELSLSVGQYARNTRCMDKYSGAFPSDPMIVDTNPDAHLPTELPLLVDYLSCMEKSIRASPSSEPTENNTDADVSLELSLSTMYGGSNSKHHNQKPKDGFPSDKKRQTMEENQQLSTTGTKSKVEAVTLRIGDELRLGHGHGHEYDPWCIKKKLFVSDIGHMARLLLPKKLVRAEILAHWNADQEAGIKEGVEVSFLDCDTNTRYDGILFKRWKNGAYVFIKKWTALVRARQLKINDEIGLYWDISNSTFNFSVLNRAPTK